MSPALLSLILAVAAAAVLIPILMTLARNVGLVDQPDNTRKLHANAIPLIGGIAVFISTLLASLVAIWYGDFSLSASDKTEFLGLLIACVVILVVGVLDDRFALRGRQKLMGQILAVSVLYFFGYRFRIVEIMGFQMTFGVFSIFVVYFWCLLTINSVNLLDGADGFATTVGAIICFSVSYMAFLLGNPVDGVITLAFGGSLLSFLLFNFPPARAYLGDAGSMLIGLFIAAISIRCAFKQQLAYAVFAPITMLAVPLIDTSAAVIRRRLTGKSIYTEDRGHFHHVLAKKGFSPQTSLLYLAFFTSMTAMGAAVALTLGQAVYAFASIAMAIFFMVAFGIFGVAEFKLLSKKVSNLLLSFIRLPKRKIGNQAQESTLSLQGDEDWAAIWRHFRSFAESHDLSMIVLDVNAPWRHESFHAYWRQSTFNRSANHNWCVELPIVVEQRIWGRIEIFAPKVTRASHHEIIGDLLKMIAICETKLAQNSSVLEIAQDLAGIKFNVPPAAPTDLEQNLPAS
ncbi:MAG: undecaprenyl/decaprenyl-phosphate alpha-N-acetylglucosaminyl 1-phosphate transferase [Pirellulaceae bacterium]|nr:undecaprenyl/decaprenyl-phosphate alpha-N-acetylglucosaminyl 1-phosphate transferase [Pirellulaceae bacterium]